MKTELNKPFDLFVILEQLRDKHETLEPEELQRLKRLAALTSSDPEAVSLYMDAHGDDWANIYPPFPKTGPMTTGQAISTFLDTYGKSSAKEEALLEQLIFNPVPEYSGVLAMQELEKGEGGEGEHDDIPADENQELSRLAKIAMSINGSEPKTTAAPNSVGALNEAPKSTSPQPMSLELAKIFVKQGHFERAHEIISKISLNNPEKSVYFADQLRFLEKLIKIKKAQQG